MEKEKDIRQIPDTTKNNFSTLQRAFESNHVAIMRAKEKETGKYVTLICAVQQEEDGGMSMIPLAKMLAEEGNPYEQYIPASDDEFDGIPSAEELKESGERITEYPVDESQSNSTAGFATVYSYNGRKYQVIEWNDRATEHEEGELTVTEIKDEEE